MKKLRIPIHSVIDVITNSSTEIFTQATETTLRLIKELILELDMTIDVEKSFNFSIQGEIDIVCDRLYDRFYDHESDLKDEDPDYKELTNDERDKFMEKVATGGFEKAPDWAEEDCFFQEDRDSSYVVVEALDDAGEKLLPFVHKLIELSSSTYSDEANNW